MHCIGGLWMGCIGGGIVGGGAE
jgi:hypothetical protein